MKKSIENSNTGVFNTDSYFAGTKIRI